MIKFKSDVSGGPEWVTNPHSAIFTIPDNVFAKIPVMAKTLKELGFFKASVMYAAAFEFFDEDGEHFTPEYQIDGCTLWVYADGDIMFEVELKNSGHSMWSEYFRVEEGVKT